MKYNRITGLTLFNIYYFIIVYVDDDSDEFSRMKKKQV